MSRDKVSIEFGVFDGTFFLRQPHCCVSDSARGNVHFAPSVAFHQHSISILQFDSLSFPWSCSINQSDNNQSINQTIIHCHHKIDKPYLALNFVLQTHSFIQRLTCPWLHLPDHYTKHQTNILSIVIHYLSSVNNPSCQIQLQKNLMPI